MRKLLLLLAILFAISAQSLAISKYEGSHSPYHAPDSVVEYPDSLKPFYISHVGRHGSRYPSSASSAIFVKNYLMRADTTGTITKEGKQLLNVVNGLMDRCSGKWGELDSLGIEEQRGIAKRMYDNYPEVFNGEYPIEAVATHSPRTALSMYAFTYQLSQLSSRLEINTAAGTRFSPTLRPYDNNEKYFVFRSSKEWRNTYDQYYDNESPVTVARRLLGTKFDANDDELREMAVNVYSLIAGMSAMAIDFDYKPYLSDEEYEALWSIANLRHYLLYTATTISTVPAELSIPLIEEIVSAADRVVEGRRPVAANLRFAHAETLMPLLSMLKIQGCHYLTHYYDQVKHNWKDYDIVPMAANLQFIFFHNEAGEVYVRTDLNERPVALIPGDSRLYLPWEALRAYLLNFILVVE